MGSVRLYAIAITEVRDIFGAAPALAERLRAIAEREFVPHRTPPIGLLGKLGPLLLQPAEAPIVRPDLPSGSDVTAVLAGHYLPPERLPAAWRLLDCWLAALAWSSWGTSLSSGTLTALDFDLARAGVSSRFALGDLVKAELGIPLLPPRGVAAGYVSAGRAEALAEAWRPALGELAAVHRPMAEDLLTWLDQFPAWTAEAQVAGRPVPDLITILHS